MRLVKALGLLIGLYLVFPINSCLAFEIQFGGCSTRDVFFDCDYVILLDAGEVSILGDPAVQATLYQQVVASIPPPYGVIVAIAVGERVQQVVDRAGPGGSRVQITIRNGNLYLFDVFGQ